MVDGALLDADKDHDERRIQTLRKSEKKKLQIQGTLVVFSHTTHRGK
jgi:hypothetical protein